MTLVSHALLGNYKRVLLFKHMKQVDARRSSSPTEVAVSIVGVIVADQARTIVVMGDIRKLSPGFRTEGCEMI